MPYTVKYVDNNSLEAGKEVVKSNGSNGFKSVAYKTLKLNGAVVSTTVLSQDTYNPMQRIIERGTKQVAPTVQSTANVETPAQETNTSQQVTTEQTTQEEPVSVTVTTE